LATYFQIFDGQRCPLRNADLKIRRLMSRMYNAPLKVHAWYTRFSRVFLFYQVKGESRGQEPPLNTGRQRATCG
jgi:hypothetical protein